LHKVHLINQHFSLYFTKTATTSSYMIRFLRSWCRDFPLAEAHNVPSIFRRSGNIWQNGFNYCSIV